MRDRVSRRVYLALRNQSRAVSAYVMSRVDQLDAKALAAKEAGDEPRRKAAAVASIELLELAVWVLKSGQRRTEAEVARLKARIKLLGKGGAP